MQEPTLVHQIRFNQVFLEKNIEGLTHEQSMMEPAGGGNCINWVFGHICRARNGMVKLLRGAGHLPDETLVPYRKAGNFTPDQAIDFQELVGHYRAMQQQIVDGLLEIDRERFASPAPFSPIDDPNETLGSLLTKLVTHEAYHAGQTGTLRRAIGLPGVIGQKA